MAEVSNILSRPDQITVLPDLSAGCSMADMANLAKVERTYRELSKVLNFNETITPITYINSAADLKETRHRKYYNFIYYTCFRFEYDR